MSTEEKIAIMQAYVEGKTIQWIYNGNWTDVTEPPIWNWRDNSYRVKPEEEYRPYKDYHEMVEDFCDRFGVDCPAYAMPMIWLKSKIRDYVFFINTFDNRLDSPAVAFNHYYNNVTYLDGSPVGKKVEE